MKRLAQSIRFILFFALAGCGIGNSEDDSVQAKLQRDNEKLSATYGSVAGLYRGTLTTGSEKQALPAVVQLYIDTVQDGVDANNAPKSRLVLRAQLKLETVGELDDHNFNVDFSDFSGAALFTQSGAGSGSGSGAGSGSGGGTVRACPVGPRDPLLAVSARIAGGFLNGTVNGSNGQVGTLSLERQSTESTQPLRDQRERLVNAYRKISGTYEGQVATSRGSLDSQVIIRVVDEASGEGVACPSLRAQFKFTKVVGKLDDSQFAVSYRQTTDEIFFTPIRSGDASPASGGSASPGGSAVRVCPVGPKDSQLAFEGSIRGKRLLGELRGSSGQIGTVDLPWVSAASSSIDDQRQRLLDAYSAIAGTYGGLFKNSNSPETFPVKITVNLTDEVVGGFVRCPALRGYYSRPDLTPGVGVLAVNADFYPADNMLILKSTTSTGGGGSGGGIPGHTDLSITAAWAQTGFAGSMNWWDRIGQVSLARCKGESVDKKTGACLN